jgi:hypothetical protein
LQSFDTLQSLSLFLLNFLIFGRQKHLELCPFIVNVLVVLPQLFEFIYLFRELLLCLFKLLPNQGFSLRLRNDGILDLVKLTELLLLIELLFCLLNLFAAQLKDIKQPHLGDQLRHIVRVMYDILPYSTPLQIRTVIFVLILLQN